MLFSRTILCQFGLVGGHPSKINASGIVKSSRTTLVWLTALVLLLHTHKSLAQFDPSTQQGAAETTSDQGYWRLKTQAATRSTRVQFFAPNHQLLYEENLPEKWVKLSRKNQKQFDQLLTQLVANQLLSTRIKTEALPPTPVESAPPSLTVRTATSANSTAPTGNYQVHAYMNATGKLYLIVDNPDRLRYMIKVVDQRNRPLYEEFTNRDQYRRKLDVSALPQDSYQAMVQIDNKPFIYQIRRQDSRFAFSIQPKSRASQEVVDEKKQTDKEALLMPVNIDL